MEIKNYFYKKIVEHCKKEYPKEACGILIGKDNKVKKVYKMKNIADNPQTCYLIDSQEQLEVFKQMESLGYELVGIYHSHTGTDAYPSQRDIEMAYYPEAIYTIVSLKDFNNPKVCAFKILEGKIEEVIIRKV